MASEILLQKAKDVKSIARLGRSVRKLSQEGKKRNVTNLTKCSFSSDAMSGQSCSIFQNKPHRLDISRKYCDARPINPSISSNKLIFIDTLALSKQFHQNGFSVEQSECLTAAFVDIINTAVESTTKTMVTKPQQEIMVQQLLAQIQSVKKDMIILEKSEFTNLRNETEKQSLELQQLQKNLQNDISKLRSNVTLDINLERSRATEAHALNEKQLQVLHNKIDTEVANLRTTYEKYRNDVMKYSAGFLISTATICLGIMRLFSR